MGLYLLHNFLELVVSIFVLNLYKKKIAQLYYDIFLALSVKRSC